MNRSIDSFSLNFACRVADKFIPGVTIQRGFYRFRGRSKEDQVDFPSMSIAGKHDFGGDVGLCKMNIIVPAHNDAWMKYPPIVIVEEPWLSPVFPEQEQGYANWHRYPDGEICWTEPVRWFDQCQSAVGLDGVEHAIQQMLKDVDFVLSCHMAAFCHRLLKWQSSWPCAPHGYQN